ncbi:MAG: adenylate kinase family protein [Methanobrevibacter sp.]|uniref:Putative adenylate kinase n=1 Tax=Methanobrevibacter millerae TaxID=230361 RepID=A0A8T3VEZ4_9EURY|nr:adenylate kinase family protein [Methanobrevibacter millerae]MBE6505762.1 AAA family ATPase [Methanobrevibacter millerae]MBR0057999.1 adenylate kinase family protein [Methanobrevibacter sp.]MBR0371900.1 adenylate kinase family protein [Methanobrevibacter sp.]
MSNIIFISGTPCTGKTTISEKLSEKLNWELVKINDLAISNNLVLGIDEDKGYKIIDVDALNDLLLKIISEHDNLIVEGHLSHLCSGADKLIVLRCRPEILKERLALRNYSSSKINENLEAEAMGVCSAESLDIYDNNVYELDVSDLAIGEAVSILMDVINGQKDLSFGEIDFMDWLLVY